MEKVTFNTNIYGHSGVLLFEEGQKVDLWEENWEEGYYSTLCPDIWYPKRLKTVSVFHNRIIGVYRPETFKEY